MKFQLSELANRVAGAAHSRRLYQAGSQIWKKTIDGLAQEVGNWFAANSGPEPLTFALLADGLAVCGVPIVPAPPPVMRFVAQLKERAVEIIALQRGCTAAELETLLAFLSADPKEIAASASWLKDRGAVHIEIRHLRLVAGGGAASEAAPEPPPPIASPVRDLYRMGSQTLGKTLAQAAKAESLELKPVLELASAIRELVGGGSPVATLLALRDRDDFLAVHSLNVGLMAAAQASMMGLKREETEEVALAGLLHDVGKVKLPPALLAPHGPLSSEELILLETHTIEGAKLVWATPGASKQVAVVCAEHHRPAVSGQSPPLLATQLVALADALDGLRSLRPFDDRRGVRSALSWLIERQSDRFNPYLLARFCSLCGLFRPGDQERLISGETVQVVRTHPENARVPTIEVLEPGPGKLAKGKMVDLSGQQPGVPRVDLLLPPLGELASVETVELESLG
jgi:HD-GYP domain-containing protein (c-di-GMP phosphodiesterase class II)